MSGTGYWRLALRMLARDWRAGEQRLLVVSLVIAVAATTAIGLVTDRLGRGLLNQSADLLGADLVLSGTRPASPGWLDQATRQGLRVAETLEFASVVVAGESLQLASVRAVDDRFPLRGSLRTALAPYTSDVSTSGIPDTGEVWAAPRLFSRLGITVGDRIEIGARGFTVSRVLNFEPGQAGDVFGVSPRVLMNLADVPATQVVQPGSRISYQYLFAGAEQAVARYRGWLEPRLQPGHELRGVREGRRAVGKALDRAEHFLGLAVLAALVLAGVAIAMAAQRYSERHFDTSAMLRCLGTSQRDLLALYLPQLLLLGVLASALGCLLGWLAQFGLLHLLADLLPAAPSVMQPWPVAGGFATGLVILAGFALPPVLRLRDVPPLRVLRRELEPLPVRGWLLYGAALAAVLALMWRYTGNWSLTLAVLAGVAAALALLGLLALLLLWLGRRLNARVGVAWRFGINNLWRRPRTSISQVLAFGLTLMAMALIALLRSDLLESWQRQLPADVPNHFAINILPDRVAGVETFLQRHGVEASQLYPMVRGRLVGINDRPVREAVSKEERDSRTLNRELNLTWSMTLQEDNRIVSGRWWRTGDGGRALVSVEAELAERFGIVPGDRLDFDIGGQGLRATVSSIRSVQWDSFRPNFYMIFPAGVLDRYAATYMTSFYLPAADKSLLVELVREFPALTVLELDRIIDQVERIFRQVTLAVEYVLVFVLLAGFAVLFAALQASLDDRLYEGAVLRALGGSRRQLRAGHLAEFALLGALAGLLAALGTECIAWLLYSKVMQLDYSFKWQVWLVTPLAGALLVGIAGYRGTRPVLERSPALLLREG